jgi:hypothetical protein
MKKRGKLLQIILFVFVEYISSLVSIVFFILCPLANCILLSPLFPDTQSFPCFRAGASNLFSQMATVIIAGCFIGSTCKSGIPYCLNYWIAPGLDYGIGSMLI